jgi:hypothetical protein
MNWDKIKILADISKCITLQVIYTGGVTSRFVSLFYLSVYIGDLYAISETPSVLRSYEINSIESCADGGLLVC